MDERTNEKQPGPAVCRACQAEIFWIRLEDTGRLMAVEPDPISVYSLDGVTVAAGHVPHRLVCKYVDQPNKGKRRRTHSRLAQ